MHNKLFSRNLFAFYSLATLFLCIGFITKQKPRYIYNLIIIYLLYCLFLYFETKYYLSIKTYIKALILLTILSHLFIGQYLNLYITSKYFDNILHVIGSLSFSLFFFAIIDSLITIPNNSKTFNFILLTSLGITIGVYLEILEFVIDIILKSNHQKGLIDTNLDLIFNIFGSVSAGFLGVFKKELILHRDHH